MAGPLGCKGRQKKAAKEAGSRQQKKKKKRTLALCPGNLGHWPRAGPYIAQRRTSGSLLARPVQRFIFQTLSLEAERNFSRFGSFGSV